MWRQSIQQTTTSPTITPQTRGGGGEADAGEEDAGEADAVEADAGVADAVAVAVEEEVDRGDLLQCGPRHPPGVPGHVLPP